MAKTPDDNYPNWFLRAMDDVFFNPKPRPPNPLIVGPKTKEHIDKVREEDPRVDALFSAHEVWYNAALDRWREQMDGWEEGKPYSPALQQWLEWLEESS